MNDALTLVLGLCLAGLGGELFVRGTVGLAVWARVPAGVVGVTVAAFATSSPELSVAVSAAGAGQPQIALGDALGSNVTNMGLVLGLTAAISPIVVRRGGSAADFPLALAAPVLTAVLVVDGLLSRLDALVLLLVFVVWLGYVTSQAWRQRAASADVLTEDVGWRAVRDAVGGLVALVAAGQLIVDAAKGIGAALGMDPFVVGATMVAVATSTPELATTLLAKVRGHDDVGLGTVLGSNVFNGLLIVSVAALIDPIRLPVGEVATGLGFGVLTVLLAYPMRGSVLTRQRGALLLVGYAGYVGLLLAFPPTSG